MDQLDSLNPVEQHLVDRANARQIPISAALELTPVCNLRCEMCYVRLSAHQAEERGGIRPMAFWLEQAAQIQKTGTLFLLLTGGEPLLYPHFSELYLTLHEMGFILTLNTNATLITPEIADMLAQHRPRRVNLTLYGASDETYRNLCHLEHGYEKAIRGLDLLQERDIQIRLNLTQVQKNQQDYLPLLQLARSRKLFAVAANYISVYNTNGTSLSSSCPGAQAENIRELRNTPWQAAVNELNFKSFELCEQFPEYIALRQEYLNGPKTPDIEGIALSCRAGKSSCWINWQGHLQACVDMNEPFIDLRSTSVATAWEELKAALARLPLHTECRGCKLRPLCDVCYANATNEKRHCGSLNYLCDMARAKAQVIMEMKPEDLKGPETHG